MLNFIGEEVKKILFGVILKLYRLDVDGLVLYVLFAFIFINKCIDSFHNKAFLIVFPIKRRLLSEKDSLQGFMIPIRKFDDMFLFYVLSFV